MGNYMRLIFFDVDGVLNQLQKWHIDDNCVKVLAQLVDSDTKLVLVSTWRLGLERDIDSCSDQVIKLRKSLQKYGMDVVYKTQKLGDRRKEIDEFLRGKSVDNYVVLDDDKSEYSSVKGLNFYEVSHKTGLVKSDIAKIRKIMR